MYNQEYWLIENGHTYKLYCSGRLTENVELVEINYKICEKHCNMIMELSEYFTDIGVVKYLLQILRTTVKIKHIFLWDGFEKLVPEYDKYFKLNGDLIMFKQ